MMLDALLVATIAVVVIAGVLAALIVDEASDRYFEEDD
jgi:hypothetical protein